MLSIQASRIVPILLQPIEMVARDLARVDANALLGFKKDILKASWWLFGFRPVRGGRRIGPVEDTVRD